METILAALQMTVPSHRALSRERYPVESRGTEEGGCVVLRPIGSVGDMSPPNTRTWAASHTAT